MMAKTNHWGALVAAAGTLVAVGLLMLIMLVMIEARSAGAPSAGKPPGNIANQPLNLIAYSGYDGKDFEIYTINAVGGGRVQLTNNTTSTRSPTYSHDGPEIVYSGYDGKDFEIYTINANGSGTTQLTNNTTSDIDPSWAR